jgi:hypothetical protein
MILNHKFKTEKILRNKKKNFVLDFIYCFLERLYFIFLKVNLKKQFKKEI